MVAPIVSFYESDDTTAYDNSSNPVNHGNVVAGQNGPEVQIDIWNNKAGSDVVSDMTNVSLGTVTVNGLTTGDTVANGQEIVTNQELQVKSLDITNDTYQAVGGSTTKSLPNISGAIEGAKDSVNVKLVLPTNATASPSGVSQAYLHRLFYSYI